MLGFAVIDRQQGADETVVWLTSQVGPAAAANTNAVVIVDTDDEARQKFTAMVADRITVTTEGTTASVKHPMPVDALGRLVDETIHLQARVGRLSKPLPTVPEPPGDLSSSSPTERTLAVANYVARVWTCWLATEDHLRRKDEAERRRAGEVGDRPAKQRVFPESFRVRPEPLQRRRR